MEIIEILFNNINIMVYNYMFFKLLNCLGYNGDSQLNHLNVHINYKRVINYASSNATSEESCLFSSILFYFS